MAQRLKHLPAMWETWVPSLGWEDPLEKDLKESDTTFTFTHYSTANRRGNDGISKRLLFSWALKSLQMVTIAMKLKDAYSLEEKL